MVGGERLQLRVSGEVGAEDLDVLVNTLILCKLFHKRRTSCCVSEADKHCAFLIGLLNQTAFVFRTRQNGWGIFFFLFFSKLLPPWQIILHSARPAASRSVVFLFLKA